MELIKKIDKNIDLTMKNRILYHLSHNDLDGYSCQYMTTKIFAKHYCYNTNYNEVNEALNIIFSFILKNRKEKYLFLITDINLTMEVATKVNNFIRGNKDIDVVVQLLDHHISGIECAEKFSWYHLNDKKCGTYLTFEWLRDTISLDFFNEKNFEYFSSIVNASDLWLKNDPYFEKGNYLSDIAFNFIKYPKIFNGHKRKHIFYILESIVNEYKLGKSIENVESKVFKIASNYLKNKIEDKFFKNENLPYKQKLCRYFYLLLMKYNDNKIEIIDIEGKKGKFIYDFGAEYFQYVSDHYIEEQNIDFLCHFGKDMKLSLRSKGEHNSVEYIAKKYFNGGGHVNASGGHVGDMKVFDKVIDQTTLEKTLKNYIDSFKIENIVKN